MTRLVKPAVLGAAMLASAAAVGATQAAEPIKMGALATLEGAFTVLGQEGMRGVELALQEHNYEVAGRKIELIKASSNAQPDSAVAAARKLAEQDGIDIMIGPLSGSEGLAIKDYAKTQLGVTFLNGASAAQDTTLRDPAPNFFRFNPDGAQWIAGLGEYTYKVKGYKRIAVVSEDYSFPYTMVFGFMKDFCKLGGKVPEKFWVPIGNKDFSAIIASLPEDIDAIFVVMAGSDALNFLSQYFQSGGDKPLVASSMTVDQSILSSKGRSKDYLVGTPSATPAADVNPLPEWKAFVDGYRKAFPKGLNSPSLFAQEYYVSTKAALAALEMVGGDLSDGHAKFRDALANLKLMTPAGMRSLDANRQVVTDIFLTEVAKGEDGDLKAKLIKVVPQVNQTLGEPMDKFLAYGPVGRDNPSCP